MWHKMSLIGKILLFTTGLGFGMAIGYSAGKQTVPSQQTTIEIKDIKTKKGGTINLDTKTHQEQENEPPEKKGLFSRIFS